MNKDIREYTESMFFGLSLRQFFFVAIGCAISVGIYFLLRDSLGEEAISWACVLGVAPCAFLGFFRYNGMPCEKIIIAIIKSKFIYPYKLMYKSENMYEEMLKEVKNAKVTKNVIKKRQRGLQGSKKRAAHNSNK